MLAHNVYFSLADNSDAAKEKLVAACKKCKHSRFLGLMKIPGHGRAGGISMARTAQGERAWGKGARRDRSWHQPD